jgi:hypothetical protein
MALPAFLGPLTTIHLTSQPDARSIGGAGTSTEKLELSVAGQEQTNWCWAAVSSSVSRFYDMASTWDQCKVANSALSRNDCCGAGAANLCNIRWCLAAALTATGNLRGQMLRRSLTFAEIRAEIARNSPVGSRVEWRGGGGHFQAIVGWLVGHEGTEYIDVSDPAFGDTQIAYSEFVAFYRSSGEWTHSYLTQSSTVTGGAAVAIAPYPDAFGA